MSDIKFISYDGEFPNLCAGYLTISIDGKEYGFIRIESGGEVWFDKDWRDHIEHGDWSIIEETLPDEIKKYKEQIEELVNKNVPHGCCGGCI